MDNIYSDRGRDILKRYQDAGVDPVKVLEDFWGSATDQENYDTLKRVARLRRNGVDIEGELAMVEAKDNLSPCNTR